MATTMPDTEFNHTRSYQGAGKLFHPGRFLRERIMLTTLVIIATVIFLWPFFVLIANSLNKIDAPMNPLLPWPKMFSLKIYELAFSSRYHFHIYILNTVLVVGATTALGTFASALTGYALAKLRFKGRNLLFGVIVAVMLLPTDTMIVPQFVVIRDLKLMNTFWAIILPGIGGGAFGIFLMRQFMLQIPTEMLEAGRIDGCSEFGLFMRIVAPLMKGPILVLATLSVRTGWNALLWPQIVLSDEAKLLLMPAILRLNNSRGIDPYVPFVVTAVAILSAIVPLGFYMYSQRFFVSALTGAFKG
jgi:ABC-type glycerol-3-phosphate transport system permease component